MPTRPLVLDSAIVPQNERAGLLYLAPGALTERDRTLAFLQCSAGATDALSPGDYAIPLQAVPMNLLGLRFTVSEDAVRLLADARTALAAADEYGLTMYSAPPFFFTSSSRIRQDSTPPMGRRADASAYSTQCSHPLEWYYRQ